MTNTYRSGLMQAKCLGALPSGTTPPALRSAACGHRNGRRNRVHPAASAPGLRGGREVVEMRAGAVRLGQGCRVKLAFLAAANDTEHLQV